MITINYYERVKEKPGVFTQLKCKELLFVRYKCPSIAISSKSAAASLYSTNPV
jgi:hypothetical protein